MYVNRIESKMFQHLNQLYPIYRECKNGKDMGGLLYNMADELGEEKLFGKLLRLDHRHIAEIYGIEVLPRIRSKEVTYEWCEKSLVDYAFGEEQKTCIHGDDQHVKVSMTYYLKLKLVIEMLKGVETLHKANIVHGDINLSNVWVRDNANAVLSNFHASHRAIDNGTATIPKPEILKRVRFWDPSILESVAFYNAFSADVFAIGFLLAELFSGSRILDHKFPHPVDTSFALEEAVATTFYEDCRFNCLRELIYRCIDLEPNLRPSVQEVRTILETLASKHQIHLVFYVFEQLEGRPFSIRDIE